MKNRTTRFNSRAEICGICLNPIEFQGKLDCCKHPFCFDCIERWSETENTCPLCKLRFTSITRVSHRVNYCTHKKPDILHVKHKSQRDVLDNQFRLVFRHNEHELDMNLGRIVFQEFQRGRSNESVLRALISYFYLNLEN
ncbi:unnamed protein product [Blepharisma stoltei]|uniref:RING-type domain-containing protein n=1 Tax=Blepharisma stoltei TaxID=1481888 RepID=A0AAU9JR68_9CILI|nr:unnamed protein product [Blepharisma stoltei]